MSTLSKSQIDWVRATFGGAIAGGVLWAVVVKMSTILDKSLSTQLRVVYSVGGGCLPILLIGVVLLRWASRSSTRTAAVAMLIAPCTGVVLVALLLVFFGLPSLLTGR
ncbi:hypothetical protein BST27_06785 [Mycobacterium intermedium]|uniref:Uncharacterized protein n=1 Tax=Mycobacterium intermedium TaxID=28445 RepID=A0A1E3SIV2_MYCIE|nr:hypothetical protein [Mycobacterium intermedium]MCV6967244.1 hypothetical protein [Mycobacterium intermedium]ODR02059.1 hypothetical protein BHQ20_06515 [Mycobacterium intermedium]OPE50229.1 hypothetical protein BV508_11115 [Mycobacterium intermedium]ORB08985.1 hypothetical protein BST27_06785 [Mycobacterium intermedium]